MSYQSTKKKFPEFHLLSETKKEKLHCATLEILEKTGVAFESQAAIDILAASGADVFNPDRVKIPASLVEQALKTTPKEVTLYTREGEPAIVLNGKTGSHFGAHTDMDDYLDPHTKIRRRCYVEDIADMARLIDALPNIEWSRTSTGHTPLPGEISDKVSLLQAILNCSKPIVCVTNDVASLSDMLELCAVVAGGEKRLKQRPFIAGSNEPTSPLFHGKDAMEKSLLLAEKGIPNVVYGMQMAGATAPATFAGCLCTANAEILSHVVVLQIKNPGAPIIFGSIPNIMDMHTTICPYGAPEMSLMVGAYTELCHYYKIPMFGTAGCTDAASIGSQAAAEITYSIYTSVLTGADLVHDVGLMDHATLLSPELTVLADEIIEMVSVLTRGIPVSDETLALDLIEKVGPRSNFLHERHTLKHFRNFWFPNVFDRSMSRDSKTKNCEQLLNEKTVEILRSHKPEPMPDEMIKELKKMEQGWFKQIGIEYEYPKKS